MPRKAAIKRHLSKEELEDRYRRESNPRLKERLLAILHLYDGKGEWEVSRIIKRSERSVRRWLRAWNNKGYGGLMPSFKGGPKPRMPEGEWDRIIEEIEGKGMTLKDVKVYVKDTRGIDYSYKTVWYVLRKKRKVKYGKPFIQSDKRPKNAEEVLKEGSMR